MSWSNTYVRHGDEIVESWPIGDPGMAALWFLQDKGKELGITAVLLGIIGEGTYQVVGLKPDGTVTVPPYTIQVEGLK